MIKNNDFVIIIILELIPQYEILGGVIMWGKETMTLSEACGISLTGIIVVFLSLIFLALAIKIVSTVLNSVVKNPPQGGAKASTQQVSKTQAPQNKGTDPKVIAAIVGAVSQAERSRVENFRIVSINEVK